MSRPSVYIVSLIRKHRLIVALGGVIGIALILISVGMTLYITSGAAGLDLSSPRSENSRRAVQPNKPAKFSPTGQLTAQDHAAFMTEFTRQRQTIDRKNVFDQKVLSDESLGLVEATALPDAGPIPGQ